MCQKKGRCLHASINLAVMKGCEPDTASVSHNAVCMACAWILATSCSKVTVPLPFL